MLINQAKKKHDVYLHSSHHDDTLCGNPYDGFPYAESPCAGSLHVPHETQQPVEPREQESQERTCIEQKELRRLPPHAREQVLLQGRSNA